MEDRLSDPTEPMTFKGGGFDPSTHLRRVARVVEAGDSICFFKRAGIEPSKVPPTEREV